MIKKTYTTDCDSHSALHGLDDVTRKLFPAGRLEARNCCSHHCWALPLDEEVLIIEFKAIELAKIELCIESLNPIALKAIKKIICHYESVEDAGGNLHRLSPANL
jgi:hypothetical protein